MASNKKVIASVLENARIACASGLAGSYGYTRDYALVLNETFKPQVVQGVTMHWYDVEHTQKGDFPELVNMEKNLFYTALRESMGDKKGDINPSSYWARIKKYGKEAIEGKPSKELVEGTENELNEGASGVDSPNRSPMLRNVEELIKLYKFNSKQESLSDKLVKANGFIMQALEALDIKVSSIKM